KLVAVAVTGVGVQVWDVREGKTPLALSVPGQNASAVAWSPDGKTLAGGAAAKEGILGAEGGEQEVLLDSGGAALAFSPNSESLAVSSATGVKVWTAFDKEPKAIPLADARTLAWSPDGSGLFGTATLAVRWQPVTGKQPAREIDAAADFPVQLTPGRPLITGIGGTMPQLWDVATGKLVGTLEGHTRGGNAPAWAKEGKHR